MKHTSILFARSFVEGIKSGRITETARPMKQYDEAIIKDGAIRQVMDEFHASTVWYKGECVRLFTAGQTIAYAELIGFRREQISAMPEESIKAQGFASQEEFSSFWRRIYGEFKPETRAWVLQFKLLEIEGHKRL